MRSCEQELTITSRSNARLRAAQKLQTQKKYRAQTGRFVVEGIRLTEEALAHGTVEEVFVSPRLENTSRGCQLLTELRKQVRIVLHCSDDILARLTAAVTHQGVAAVAALPDGSAAWKALQQPDLVVAVDRLQDPGNLGTIIRTTLAAGGQGLLLTEGSTDPYSSKCVRSSMGAVFRLPIQTVSSDELLALCAAKSLQLMTADVGQGCTYHQADLTLPCMLLIGSEAEGVSPSLLMQAAERITIPLSGGVESLNAAVCCGILLYECRRQRSCHSKKLMV